MDQVSTQAILAPDSEEDNDYAAAFEWTVTASQLSNPVDCSGDSPDAKVVTLFEVVLAVVYPKICVETFSLRGFSPFSYSGLFAASSSDEAGFDL